MHAKQRSSDTHMKPRFRIKRLIAAALILMLAVKGFGYYSASVLCAEIRAGKNISTRARNNITAPMFMRHADTVLQTLDSIVKVPLVEACEYKNLQAVQVLLENGADPDFNVPGCYTPLEAALVHGAVVDETSFEIIKLLLDGGADVNKHSFPETILRRQADRIAGDAVPDIHTDIFLYMLPYGVEEMEEKDYSIMYATLAAGRNEAAYDALLAYGREPEIHYDFSEYAHLW